MRHSAAAASRIAVSDRVARHGLGELVGGLDIGRVDLVRIVGGVFGVVFDAEDLGVADETLEREVPAGHGLPDGVDKAKAALALVAAWGHLHDSPGLATDNALKR